MKIAKFNTSMGVLESEVMDIIWKLGSASVRQVLSRLRKKKNVAYTTIMTVMSRLYDKGILARKLNKNGAYFYTPVQDKENFFAAISKRAINSLIKEFGELAVAQFIDAVESSNLKNLDEWRKKLKKIR